MNSLFFLFSSLLIVSAILVIQAKNPIHSVLFLILAFFNSSALLILLGLDFFALIFLVVYVGAIAVLFLFVVMMLNVKLAEINEKKLRYLPIGAVLAFALLFEIFLILNNDLIADSFQLTFESDLGRENFRAEYSPFVAALNSIETIGIYLYTYYFLFFLLASLILLVAMIGAIVLTMSKVAGIKRQKVYMQNSRELNRSVMKNFIISNFFF